MKALERVKRQAKRAREDNELADSVINSMERPPNRERRCEGMTIKENIKTLGIPKLHKCPHCGKRESLNISERHNLADCIISNGNGLWALLHCGHCGYVDTIYPTSINGVECTPEECEQLMNEIKKFDTKGGEEE